MGCGSRTCVAASSFNQFKVLLLYLTVRLLKHSTNILIEHGSELIDGERRRHPALDTSMWTAQGLPRSTNSLQGWHWGWLRPTLLPTRLEFLGADPRVVVWRVRLVDDSHSLARKRTQKGSLKATLTISKSQSDFDYLHVTQNALPKMHEKP